MGHDILCKGNCPAKSKFGMINDWPFPMLGQSLYSFIGLVNFYRCYAPYMDMRLKPLRGLIKKIYRKDISSTA